MQVGCCIRRALASLGTVTAVALIAATGFAGDDVISHDDQSASAQNSISANEVKASSKADYYSKQREVSPLAASIADARNVPTAQGKQAFSAPLIARGASGAGGDSCATAFDLDADLAAGMGMVTISGDTTGGSYIVDPLINAELPAASCSGTFGGFVGNAGKWYSLTGTGNPFNFDGCLAGTTFDTTFTVMSGPCGGPLVCEGGDDDNCGLGGGAFADFASSGSFNTVMGQTYFILVHSGDDGTGTPAPEGAYQFTITEGMTVTVDCSMADATESDPMCNGGGTSTDDVNPGCNGGGDPMMDFDSLLLNGQTCGIIATDNAGGTRDLDWYTIDIPAGPDVEVTITATGTTGFNFFAVDFDGVQGTVNCAGTLGVIPFGDAPGTSSADGSALTGTACLAPGQYVVVMGNTDFASFDCGVNETNYSLDVSSGACAVEACCLADGTCIEDTNPSCLAAGGTIFAGETCASLAAANMGASCIGFCCQLDGTILSPASSDDCDLLVMGGTARSFLGYNLTAQEQMDAFCPVTPDNISCDLAEPVMTDGTAVLGNTAASSYIVDASINPELPGVGCGATYVSGAGATTGLWYSFMGTGNDVTVSICDVATDYDSRLYVFCGTCECLFCVDGDDDGCAAPGLASELTVGTSMGTTYYVLVGGFSTNAGNFSLSVTDSVTPSVAPVNCVLVPVTCPMGALDEFNEDCATPPPVSKATTVATTPPRPASPSPLRISSSIRVITPRPSAVTSAPAPAWPTMTGMSSFRTPLPASPSRSPSP